MRFLQYNTAANVSLGPFLSNTDFKTPQTGLTSSSGNLLAYVNGGSPATDISARTFTHISNGIYQLQLQASDVGTLGPLVIVGIFSGVVPREFEFMVMAANPYSALFGTGTLNSNMTQISGNNTAAANLASGAAQLIPFTVQAGSSSTVIATNLTNSTSSALNGRTVTFSTGACQNQSATITGYNGATKQITVSALTAAPAAGDTAVIF